MPTYSVTFRCDIAHRLRCHEEILLGQWRGQARTCSSLIAIVHRRLLPKICPNKATP
jgi:hypothetical protein